MDKLILFNEIQKGRKKNRLFTFNKVEKNQEDHNKSDIKFEEKFYYLKDKTEFNTFKNKSINEAVERIFSLGNRMVLINFINSIYNDELSLNTKIKCINNRTNTLMEFNNCTTMIIAEDEYRKIEYTIQFQTTDDQNMGIIINKINSNNNYKNIINFDMKKKEYQNKECDFSKESFSKCLIILDSNIQVPNAYKFKSNIDGEDVGVNIIKGWKYDFKLLFEKHMYLLFPLKVIDLKKRLLDINTKLVSKNLIRSEILGFFRELNRYLNKVKAVGLITDTDINEVNLITIDLLIGLINEKNGVFTDMKIDIETTLKEIVV